MPLSTYLKKKKNLTHSYICMHICVYIFLIDSHMHLYCSLQTLSITGEHDINLAVLESTAGHPYFRLVLSLKG